MPKDFSEYECLKRYQKAKWVLILGVFTFALNFLGGNFENVSKIYDGVNRIIESLFAKDIDVESELVTDACSVNFVSSVDYGDSHERIDPFSEKDVKKALMDESLFMNSRSCVLIALRVANTNKKILNIEEVRINLRDYEKLNGKEFYDYAYVYSGSANSSYDLYDVTLDPGRSSYNALVFPFQSWTSTETLGKLYYSIQPGHSEFIVLNINLKETGIYSFTLSVKYSIDGRGKEVLTSQVFKMVHLPDNSFEGVSHIEVPAPSDSEAYFPMASFPRVSCGDSKPQEMSYYPIYMYPILILDEKDNLNRVRSDFCADAYLDKRSPGRIQVASFYDRQKGHYFSVFMCCDLQT